MRRLVTATALLILSACLAMAGENERFFEETYQVSPGARFSLDSHKGVIRIRTAQTDQVRVHARIHLGNGEADADLLDEMKIQVRNDATISHVHHWHVLPQKPVLLLLLLLEIDTMYIFCKEVI